MFLLQQPTAYKFNLCDFKECVLCCGSVIVRLQHPLEREKSNTSGMLWRRKKHKSLPWKTAYPRGKTQEWKLAEEPPHCLNCVSAVPSVSSLSVSNLLTLYVKLKVAVNHFLPCGHGQNGHQHAQTQGWLKREAARGGRKRCYSRYLSSSLLMKHSFTSTFYPEARIAI